MARPLKNLLQNVFKSENWKLKLLSQWDTIAGNLADKMRLEKIEGETLIIGVYQASWMQELYLLSNVLKKSINEHLGYPYVKRLRFKHAAPRSKKVTPLIKTETQASTNKTEKPITLSGSEQKALGKIKDTQLKEALHNFLSRCHYQKIAR